MVLYLVKRNKLLTRELSVITYWIYLRVSQLWTTVEDSAMQVTGETWLFPPIEYLLCDCATKVTVFHCRRGVWYPSHSKESFAACLSFQEVCVLTCKFSLALISDYIAEWAGCLDAQDDQTDPLVLTFWTSYKKTFILNVLPVTRGGD